MGKIKKIAALIASICMMSSMAVTVSAVEDEVVNAPDADVTDINAIVSDIIDDTLPAVTEVVTEEVTTVNTDNSEVTTVVNTDDSEVTTFTTWETLGTDSSETIVTDVTSDMIGTDVTVAENTAETTMEVVVNNYRDIVISLDVSGSMYGEPLIAMKDAAIEFCTTMLNADPTAKIAVVAFETDSSIGVNYTSDLDIITDYINNLSDKNMTNFTEAFEDIKFLLETGDGAHKSVILMADGLPNDGDYSYSGKYGSSYEYENAALEYANNEIKPLADLYTIGFFHNISDEDDKMFAEQFMADLASEPEKSYNADISNLNQVFNSIAYDIMPEAKPIIPEEKPEVETFEKEVAKKSESDSNIIAESPKTADAGIVSVAAVALLSGTIMIATKRKFK